LKNNVTKYFRNVLIFSPPDYGIRGISDHITLASIVVPDFHIDKHQQIDYIILVLI